MQLPDPISQPATNSLTTEQSKRIGTTTSKILNEYFQSGDDSDIDKIMKKVEIQKVDTLIKLPELLM